MDESIEIIYQALLLAFGLEPRNDVKHVVNEKLFAEIVGPVSKSPVELTCNDTNCLEDDVDISTPVHVAR